MSRIILIIFSVQFFQCTLKRTDKNDSTYLKSELENKSNEIEQLKTHDSIPFEAPSCECNWVIQEISHHTDLSFSNNGRPFEIDFLSKWKNNPERFKIKSLRLIDFDRIPNEMAIFENVNSVYLEGINHRNVKGLEIFPKLRILKAEDENFIINEETKWLNKIEVIQVNKTKFIGIKSFNELPNLREVRFSFSGFDTWPTDFEKLNCLTYFQTGAHTFGSINLSELDFQNMKCLRYVQFQSWEKNIKGIPSGIEHIEVVKISHPNLTLKEKDKLNKTSG